MIRKAKYMVVTQLFLLKEYPEENVLYEESHLFFRRKKDAKNQIDKITGE